MHAGDALTAINPGDSVTIVTPVIRDTSPNPLAPANTLSDIASSGYRLRRIVGKFWCFCTPAAEQTAPAVVTTAAFCILRTDPSAGTPQNPTPESYASDDILNTDAPWIWRRSWLMTNALATGTDAIRFGGLRGLDTGNTNALRGGNADGGHIDQKTARVVGPDERLFLVITTTAILAGDAQAPPLLLDYVWDVRILASMRSNVGNRGNASR